MCDSDSDGLYDSDSDSDGVDDADGAGTTGTTGTTGNGETDGKTDGSDDEVAASGGAAVDEPVDKTGKTADADGVDGVDAAVDGADADAEKAVVARAEEDMEADEEDEEDEEDDSDEEGELIDVLKLEYTHEELVMFKNDSAGQFKTFHRAMVHNGDSVDKADLDDHDELNIAKTLAKFFVAVDSPGSANEASSISYLRLTYSKCPLVNENAIITGVAPVEKSTIKELAGDNAVAIWLTDIHKDTGVKRYDNSRVYRSVKFDPSLFPELGELDLNTFVGLRFDKELPADAGAIIKMKIDMTKVTPVLEFIHAVLAAGDQDMHDYILNYLIKMVGGREKMKAALLFHGPRGASKDIIFEKLFRIFYGAYYLHKTAEGANTSFNSEMAGKLFGLWCEIKVNDDSAQALKGMLKGTTFAKHGKGKDIEARSCWRV